MDLSSSIAQGEGLTPIAKAILPLSASLTRARRLCKIIKNLIAIGGSVFFIGYAIVWTFLLVSALQGEAPGSAMGSLVSFLMTGLCGGAGAFLAYRIFDDIVRNESVFTANQISRLKSIALIFVLLFAIELIFPTGNMIINASGIEGIGIVNDATSFANAPRLNLSSLLFAAVFYCASAIFESASLLQQASDETI